MAHFSVRRVLAGLTIAGIVLAAGGPASAAQRAAAGIKMIIPDVSVALGGPGAQVRPIWSADPEVELTEPRLTYELSGLGGVALFDSDGVGHCTSESATRLVCQDHGMSMGPDGITGYFVALLTGDETAQAGAAGTLTATFSAEGVAPITETAAVRVVEGIDLAAGPDVTLRKKPGATFAIPLVVRNAGQKVAHGAAVIFNRDYAFETTQRFRNCFYRSGQLTACSFDQALEPGSTYRGAMPYKLRATTYAPGGSYAELEWLTPAELADREALLIKDGRDGFGTPGSGSVLTLAAQAQAQAQAQAPAPAPAPAPASADQGDTNPDNNWAVVEVRSIGRNGTDLVAVGDTATGAAGDVVTATVGVRNAGPATLDFNRSGETPARVKVSVPPGTSVVSVPDGCVLEGASYFCYTGTLLLAGRSTTYDFGLRVDQVVPNATGAVVVNGPCECAQFSQDLNPRNNRSAIVINRARRG